MLLLCVCALGCSPGATGAATAAPPDCKAGDPCVTITFKGGVPHDDRGSDPPILRVPRVYLTDEFAGLVGDKSQADLPTLNLRIPFEHCGVDPALFTSAELHLQLSEVGAGWGQRFTGSMHHASQYFPLSVDSRTHLLSQQLESYPRWHVRKRYSNENAGDVGYVLMECTHPVPEYTLEGWCVVRLGTMENLAAAVRFRESAAEQWPAVVACVKRLTASM